jgi:proteasome accessory factor B
MPGDYSKIQRLLRVLMMVQSSVVQRPADIARELGVVERTIFRDIDDLIAAGFPLRFDDKKKRYVIEGATYMKPVDLTIDEALAIVALGQHVGGDDQIPGMKAAASAVEKIRSQLPPAIREEVADLDPFLHIRLAPSAPPGEAMDVYDAVRLAIARRVQLRCEYESNSSPQGGKPDPFLLSPYTLFFSERAWYVAGFHEGRGEVRVLKLNRFVACQLTDQKYAIPEDFKLQTHLGNAWRMIRGKPSYDVSIRFEKAFAATVAETQWHATQETVLQEDGSLIFTCKVDGLDEIVWWVMSMGPHCKVLEPQALADRVRDLAAKVAANYAG